MTATVGSSGARAMRWHRAIGWRPRDVDWWVACLFMVGSALFALGSFPPYSQMVDPPAVGITFVVGSLFFTAAACVVLVQETRTPTTDDRTRHATGETLNITLVNSGTFLGALCFLVGSYVLLPPAVAAGVRPSSS